MIDDYWKPCYAMKVRILSNNDEEKYNLNK